MDRTPTYPPTCSARRCAELAGCTYRQLDYWCRTGLVTPSRAANGSGSRREFTIEDVQRVWALAQVLPEQRHAVSRALADYPDAQLLVLAADAAWPVHQDTTVAAVVGNEPGPLVGVLSMAAAPQAAAA